MKRYRLRNGNLLERPDGEWVAYESVSRLRAAIEAIYRHWQDGVSEDTETERPWHRKMRDLIDAARSAEGWEQESR